MLPREGYAGPVPEFPLPAATDREREVWSEAWRSPQAAAWAEESWRHRTVGLWVRLSVRLEAGTATAALGAVVMRLQDQVGLTPAGLNENRWAIAEPSSGRVRQDVPRASAVSPVRSVDRARDRFASLRQRAEDGDDSA